MVACSFGLLCFSCERREQPHGLPGRIKYAGTMLNAYKDGNRMVSLGADEIGKWEFRTRRTTPVSLRLPTSVEGA